MYTHFQSPLEYKVSISNECVVAQEGALAALLDALTNDVHCIDADSAAHHHQMKEVQLPSLPQASARRCRLHPPASWLLGCMMELTEQKK